MSAFLTPKQLASRWNCSPQHICRLLASSQLPGLRLGRQWRVAEEAASKYELAHTSHPAVKPPSPEPARLSPPGPTGTAAILGPLPDGYEPRFPQAWGLPPKTNSAASSAAGGSRSARTKKTAPQRH